tara:strand:- start:74 stop:361 length:288 start_codon:yes stop_codon:yes gene_type:complete
MIIMKIGNTVSFTYLKGSNPSLIGGMLAKDYASKAEGYSGQVVEIRDLEKNPVSNQTLRYGQIKGHRSKNLVTVELKSGDTKAFYDGRMIGLKIS